MESKKNTTLPGIVNFHCSLGPGGLCYINDGYNVQHYRLPASIIQELETRQNTKDNHTGDPEQIALGINGAYVIVGKNGYASWDLQGFYGSLDKALCEAKSRVKVSGILKFAFALLESSRD